MPIRALIVDDQPDIRLLLRTFIEAEGIEVVGEAEDGSQALAQIEVLDPNVVVLDHMMPGMTGLETAARILERRPDQAILLCTAYLNDGVESEAKEIGIRACMPKFHIARVAGYVESVA